MIKKTLLAAACFIFGATTFAQETFNVNGVADDRTHAYAFTNATIVKDAQTTLTDATLLIKDGKIVAAGKGLSIPAGTVTINCKGKFIYPSFIDAYADYGIPTPQRSGNYNFFAPAQLETNTKGAYGWNQALKSQVNAAEIFMADAAKAKALREQGFGVVLTHQKDGIARGTGALVTLADEKENFTIIKQKASNHLSLNKGSSTQSYPNSMMGMIALLRQTYLDGRWYQQARKTEGLNQSLQAWNNNLALPQIFEANDKWNCLRADRIGDEFGAKYILKTSGNEFERINEIKATGDALIVTLNFPQAMDVEDPNDARFVDLATLKYWEMAPANPAAVQKAGILFCLTAADLKDPKQFLTNLRKAMAYGLTETAALDALTKTPATLLNAYNETGSIDAGKWANFLITDGPVFAEKTSLLQNWVQGQKYDIKKEALADVKGVYAIQLNNNGILKNYTLNVKSSNSADLVAIDSVPAKFSFDGKLVKLNFTETKKAKKGYRLSGVNNGTTWQGNGVDTLGNPILWTASFVRETPDKPDTSKPKNLPIESTLTYPNMAYGVTALPQQQTMLIKNGTVWTSDKAGILENTDVLVQNGKIKKIGKNLSSSGATVIDATGKFVTPGVIDEHSHIATTSINEGGQSVTSEVRIGDNLDPDDINIYRQLSGGVTTSHILHGSANTIGGQTQLIKLRWGVDDEGLKFKGADPFIKFALGENVKRNPALNNNRFPDSRMGVQQVQYDAFTRAQDYERALKGADAKNVRRDLELDALVEIMNKKRFITCHSYVSSEILETMRMAEHFGFTINTFTHILEGYKVADKMKAHGANASTFSDWWAYKLEVQDAIAYNAAIMTRVGLNVAINSDDAEMARRLNQEAAKSIKYGGLSPEEAFKMVTINPANMLHIQNQTGSLAEGKDADIVIWNNDPTSIYAQAEKTIVDGTIFFDREKDKQMRAAIAVERNRLIQKMLDEKKGGAPMAPAKPSNKLVNTCQEDAHAHGILDYADEDENEQAQAGSK